MVDQKLMNHSEREGVVQRKIYRGERRVHREIKKQKLILNSQSFILNLIRANLGWFAGANKTGKFVDFI